jgi:tRNA (mo5U34)-methyltransferase
MLRTIERDHPPVSIEGLADLAPWFHNLHLPDGTQTAPQHPLGDFPAYKWKRLAPLLPTALDGWRVLDIGCNAGFYTFELARRGANVLGIDIEERYLRQARWAAAQYGLEERVEFRRMQVYDLARMQETFDLVLFMGVFYHLRYPLLALDLVAEKVRRLLVFQSLTTPGEQVYEETHDREIDDREALNDPGWPRMAFIERSLAGDPTNWWVPNHAGIEAMLRSAGFTIVAAPGHEIYVAEPATAEAGTRAPCDLSAEIQSATGR